MLKNFKLGIMIFVLTASCIEAVAQTSIYKDVILNGKPAKLNVKTGKIRLVNAMLADSTLMKKLDYEEKSVTDANLITSAPKKKLTTTDISKSNKFERSNMRIASNDTTELLENIVLDSVVIENKSTKRINTSKETSPIKDALEVVNNEKNATNYHIVKIGETLHSISKRYKININDLKNANNLGSTFIRVGQNLRIRNFNIDLKNDPKEWVVANGDTLFNIAKRNNMSVENLKRLNGLTSNLIQVGQKLKIN